MNRMSATFTVAVAMALLVVKPAHGFWRMSCSTIQMGRVDPVLAFGQVSQHVHKISGASKINPSSTYAELVSSPCTSCQVQADKSAYWTPTLYYHHSNGMYEEVENGGMAVYYLGRGYDGHGSPYGQPFPPGLKFLSGNSNARSFNSTLTYNGNATYLGVPIANRVSFACLDYNNPHPQTNYMANTNCPDGLRAQIDFQSCWDGVNLYKDDQSHVDYLSQIDNGVCPPTHPVLFPHLFIEVLYAMDSVTQDGGRFVFSNGDETGYGFHGDFINGWDIPTLTATINQCALGNPSGVIEQCPPLVPSDRTDFATFCPETSPIWPCEPVHGKIQKLPGCITPTDFNHVVVPSDNTCPQGNYANCTANDNNGPPAPYPGDSQYTLLGCYTDSAPTRAILGTTESISNMTAQNCIAFCKGSTYVGVEYSSECYCSNTLASSSTLRPSTECAMTCSGDRWQVCGGPDRLTVFKHK